MLLNLGFSKDVFFDYWDIKLELFRASGVKYSFKTSLTDIQIPRCKIQSSAEYIGRGVWNALAPWIQSKEHDLKNFRKRSRSGNTNASIMVERNRKLFKVSSTSAAPLAFRMVQFYMAEDVVNRGLDHEAARHNRNKK
jgi:hypothetical protein